MFRRLTRIIWILKSYRKCGATTQGMCCLIWRTRIRCKSQYNASNKGRRIWLDVAQENGILYIYSALVNLLHANLPLISLLLLFFSYDLWYSPKHCLPPASVSLRLEIHVPDQSVLHNSSSNLAVHANIKRI